MPISTVALVPDHPKHRAVAACWDAESGTISREASDGEALIVLRAMCPLALAGPGELRPGWDGSLGYAHYGLHLPAGVATTRLRLAEPVTFEQPRHDPAPLAVSDVTAWQGRRRGELARRLMGAGCNEDAPLRTQHEGEQTVDGLLVERWSCETRPGRRCVFLLARPRGPTRRLLLAVHGHEAPWGEADPLAFAAGHNDSFCRAFVEAGWAVVQPATMDHGLYGAGWTLLGSWSWDARRCLAAAAEVLGNDPDCAVCGLSVGGQIALTALVLDPRLRAGVCAGSFSTWRHYHERMLIPPHCDCGVSALLSGWLDQADWLALAAPRPVQLQHGRRDVCFAPDADPARLDPAWNRAVMPGAEFAAEVARARLAWAANGRDGALAYHEHDGAHGVDEPAAVAWLEAALQEG